MKEIENTPLIKAKMNKQSGLRSAAEIFLENFVEIANTPLIKAKMNKQSGLRSAAEIFLEKFRRNCKHSATISVFAQCCI